MNMLRFRAVMRVDKLSCFIWKDFEGVGDITDNMECVRLVCVCVGGGKGLT